MDDLKNLVQSILLGTLTVFIFLNIHEVNDFFLGLLEWRP